MKTLEEQIGGKCLHFSGIQNATCRAGVRYTDVETGERAMRRLPCFRDEGNGETCASAAWRTPEEVATQVAESRERTRVFLEKLNSDECPHCGGMSAPRRQVGRCVYGACGCRLYQGIRRLRVQALPGNDSAHEEGRMRTPRLTAEERSAEERGRALVTEVLRIIDRGGIGAGAAADDAAASAILSAEEAARREAIEECLDMRNGHALHGAGWWAADGCANRIRALSTKKEPDHG